MRLKIKLDQLYFLHMVPKSVPTEAEDLKMTYIDNVFGIKSLMRRKFT